MKESVEAQGEGEKGGSPRLVMEVLGAKGTRRSTEVGEWTEVGVKSYGLLVKVAQ